MALTPNEAYAAKQPFVDKETLEHIVEQFPTPFHLYDEAGIRQFGAFPSRRGGGHPPQHARSARRLCMEPGL